MILPEGIGRFETIFKPLTHVVTEPSHLPGLRVTDVTVDLVKSTAVSELPWLVAGLTSLDIAKQKARRTLAPRYEDFMSPIQFQYQEPKITVMERQKMVEVQKPVVEQKLRLGEIPLQVPTITLKTEEILSLGSVQKISMDVLQVPKQVEQAQKEALAMPSLGDITRIDHEKSKPRLYVEERKRRRRKMNPLGAVGELRLRPVGFRSLKDVLKV
jgi:hypothetical protein